MKKVSNDKGFKGNPTVLKGRHIYINREDILNEVIISKANKNRCTDRLARMFMVMANLVRRKYFSYSEELISKEIPQELECDAVLRAIEMIEEFDVNRSKQAYAFFQSVIYNELKASFNRNEKLVKNSEGCISIDALEDGYENDNFNPNLSVGALKEYLS